jgi:hypothetical protein
VPQTRRPPTTITNLAELTGVMSALQYMCHSRPLICTIIGDNHLVISHLKRHKLTRAPHIHDICLCVCVCVCVCCISYLEPDNPSAGSASLLAVRHIKYTLPRLPRVHGHNWPGRSIARCRRPVGASGRKEKAHIRDVYRRARRAVLLQFHD